MILLDTCVLLWLAADPSPLPESVKTHIRNVAPGQRYLSAISMFEIGVKHSRGKLVLPQPPRTWFERQCAARSINVLPVTASIAARATELPWHHRDPADRMILATALEYDLPIVTCDEAFKAYNNVRLLW